MKPRLLPLGLVALGAWIVYGCGGGSGTETGTGGDTGAAGAGGSTGGGAAGTGGTTATAGTGGGTAGAGPGGSGGSATGRGGATGTAGATGRGGSTGTGGTAVTGTGGSASGAALCTWPTATTTVPLSATQTITGTYDGTMRRFIGAGALGTSGQTENQDPLFNLANGATLMNAIIGNPAADGIHCEGSCTLKNVWWEDVGEDAATLQGTSTS